MMQRRSGLTIIELLVSMSILGVLAALILPAIMHMRESQRRVTCQTRLANVTRALGGYESAHGHYPGALEGHPDPQPYPFTVFYHFSPWAKLLPYLDQRALFEKIDFRVQDMLPLNPETGVVVFASVSQARIPVFVCPSDDRSGGKLPGSNYRVSLGIGPDYSDRAGKTAKGAFSAHSFRRPAEFRDGMSTTIGISERRVGSWIANAYSSPDDIWFSGIDQMQVEPPPLEDMIDLCSSVSATPAQFYVFSGATWFYGTFETTWYNHAVSPNSRVPSCSAGILGVGPLGDGPRDSYAIVGASSRHSGGVNAAFMDGAVKFIGDTIDLNVWRALATIQGQDPVADLH